MEGNYVGDGWLRRVLLVGAQRRSLGWVLWVPRGSWRTPFPAVCPRGRRLGRSWGISPNDAVSISGGFQSPSSQLERDETRTQPCVCPHPVPLPGRRRPRGLILMFPTLPFPSTWGSLPHVGLPSLCAPLMPLSSPSTPNATTHHIPVSWSDNAGGTVLQGHRLAAVGALPKCYLGNWKRNREKKWKLKRGKN